MELGLVRAEQLNEGLKTQAAYKAKGVAKTLGAVLHDQGVLNLQQIDEIWRAIDPRGREGALPGYRIDELLGKGSMGAVYRGTQTSIGREVAIKVLAPHLVDNPTALGRFQREAEAAAALHHPNVVRALDVGEDRGYHYLVMEYIDGVSLRDRMREGPVPEEDLLEIGEEIASALKLAGEHGLVHRDVKPANILLTRDGGQAKLCDMGLAKPRVGGPELTMPGTIVGSPFYVSPEQARQKTLDTRSDLYSLGATFYHASTGMPPFPGKMPVQILQAVLNDEVRPPSVFREDISDSFEHVILKLLRKDPDERYQTPEELMEDLRRIRTEGYLPGMKPGILRRFLQALGLAD